VWPARHNATVERTGNVLRGQSALQYGGNRPESLLGFIGPLQGTVVDVGAGRGAWGPDLRRAGAGRLIAVEPDEASADEAQSRYDVVLRGRIEETAAEFVSEADWIILADCLEHLVDPWATLRWLHDAARVDARLIVSIPNLRYLGLVGPLLLAGRFNYSDRGGIMDRGHLRWFTRRSLEHAAMSAGWSPVAWSGECGTGTRATIDRLTVHRLRELLVHQLYMKAVKQ